MGLAILLTTTVKESALVSKFDYLRSPGNPHLVLADIMSSFFFKSKETTYSVCLLV